MGLGSWFDRQWAGFNDPGNVGSMKVAEAINAARLQNAVRQQQMQHADYEQSASVRDRLEKAMMADVELGLTGDRALPEVRMGDAVVQPAATRSLGDVRFNRETQQQQEMRRALALEQQKRQRVVPEGTLPYFKGGSIDESVLRELGDVWSTKEQIGAGDRRARMQEAGESSRFNARLGIERGKTEQEQAQRARLVAAVRANPAAWDNIPPTLQAELIPELAQAPGSFQFGRPMTGTAIDKMSAGSSAAASLGDLRKVLVENEQYMGPVAGYQAMNPWSDARKAQADINRVRQRVGKMLEGGVLRLEDEKKYKEILATLLDEPETAIYKVDQMMVDIQRDMDNFREEQRRSGRRVDIGGTPRPPNIDPNRAAGTVIVQAPNGKTYTFPTREQADAFRRRAGMLR